MRSSFSYSDGASLHHCQSYHACRTNRICLDGGFISIVLYDQHEVAPSIVRRWRFLGCRVVDELPVHNQSVIVTTRRQEQRPQPTSLASGAHRCGGWTPIVECPRTGDAMSERVLEFEKDAPQFWFGCWASCFHLTGAVVRVVRRAIPVVSACVRRDRSFLAFRLRWL